MCGVLGWLQWPPRPHRRTSRCPRRRCRSRCPASCLHSEGVLPHCAGLLGTLLHAMEVEPGSLLGAQGTVLLPLTLTRPAPAAPSPGVKGPWPLPRRMQGTWSHPLWDLCRPFPRDSGPGAGEGPGGLVRPRRGCPTLGMCVLPCTSPCSAVYIPGLRIA